MKQLYLIISFLSIFEGAKAQQWEWGKAFIGGAYSEVKKTVVDDFGNVFVLGYIDVNIVYETTSLDSGIYIAKFQSNGTFLWAKNISNALNENPHALNVSMDIDDNGDVIVLGTYTNLFNYDLLTVQSSGSRDVFLLKVNTLGQGVWLKSFGGNNNDIGSAIVTDSLSIYITGTASGSATFGNLTLNDTSTNIQYISKINSSGMSVWVEKSVYENSSGLDISIGEQGNIYTGGIINCNVTTQFTYCTQYIHKYSPLGIPLLSKIYGTPSDPADIISRDDQIYISQDNCGPGACWSTLTKYDTQMNQKWSKQMGDSYSDYWCGDVHLGLDKSIYATAMFGFYNTSVDSIQFGSIWVKINHQESSNMAIARMDSNGTFQVAKPFYIKNSWYGQNCLSVDNNYNCYIAGSLMLADTVTVGGDTIICSQKGFIAKLSNTNLTGVLESEKASVIKVYPNPSSGIFTVSFNKRNVETKICVYDLLGNCLLNKVYENDVSPKIDLNNQPKGIYFMEILSDGERSVKKIVLQ